METLAQDADPVLGRFGDHAHAITHVDGRQWIVREHDWYDWPDPPRYVFFALEEERIGAARDFNLWPRAWRFDC